LTDAAVADTTRTQNESAPATADDVAALVEGIQDGTIDAIASDHARITSLEDVGIRSCAVWDNRTETAVGLALTAQLPIGRLIELFSTNPQRS
jgi:dihydroorotase-like cyclic amidohydrolase